MRDHEPIILEEFRGLFARGSEDSVPIDHFSDCNNISFVESAFHTRPGIQPIFPYGDVVRMVTFIAQNSGVVTEGLIVLTSDGNFYHTAAPNPNIPILTIPGATGFGFVAYAGRAYITPNHIYVDATGNEAIYGLQNEYVYVYKGDGSPATLAAGSGPPAPAPTIAIRTDITGTVAPGTKVYAYAYETNTGFITPPSPKVAFSFGTYGNDEDRKAVRMFGIIPGPPNTVAVWIMMSQAIDPTLFTGNLDDYELFFCFRIPNNTTNFVTINEPDEALIKSADYLNDQFTKIPAGANLSVYHGRLVVIGNYDNISIAYLSTPGQPESINQVSGIIIIPLDGRPLTCAQEYRDSLVIFKQSRTYAYSDNGGDPSSWTITILDQGVGASPYGVATVLDSGGINIEYLIIADYSGIMIFNGTYVRPELSWKIANRWLDLDRKVFHMTQILNDTITQHIYIVTTAGNLIVGNYAENSLGYQEIRWSPWSFAINVKTLAFLYGNSLMLGAGNTPFGSFTLSGVHQLVPTATHDTVYNMFAFPGIYTTIDQAIPEPFIQTAPLPSSDS